MIKVNLGCGKRNFGSDWIHIDGSNYPHVQYHNIIDLPFKENSVDIIYASHVFEYFNREEGKDVLYKWKSFLKKDGILRLAVPNFAQYAKLYSENKISLDQCVGPLYGKWNMTKDKVIYHKTTYDFISIKKILNEVGFKKIQLWDYNHVEHSHIDDYSKSYIPHMDKNGSLMSLNIQAIK